jgi:lysozyme
MKNPMQPSMLALVTAEEGLRLHVYDDATGIDIKPGSVVIGHPTVGIGEALDVDGLTQDEAEMILNNRIVKIERALAAFAWWRLASDNRKDVLTNMAFNIGIAGILGFHGMISALMHMDYKTAASEMLNSRWANQVGSRAHVLAHIMETNAAPVA